MATASSATGRKYFVLPLLLGGLFASACDGTEVPTADPPSSEFTLHAADALPSSLHEEDLLQVVAAGSGYYLEAKNFGISSWTPIVGTSSGLQFSKQWRMKRLANGRYTLMNANSGKCASVSYASTANNALVIQDDCKEDATHSQWQAVEIIPNYFQFRAGHSGKCLEMPYITGSQLRQWDCASPAGSQLWLVRLAPMTEIRVPTGIGNAVKCLTAQDSSEGAALEQWSCNSSSKQQFWVGQGPGGALALRARNGQRCIDIAGMGVDNGTKAQLWSCGYWLSSQLFSPIRTSIATSSQRYYKLQAGHVAKCLDRSGLPNSDDGANLQLWSCSGQANQAFLLPGIVL